MLVALLVGLAIAAIAAIVTMRAKQAELEREVRNRVTAARTESATARRAGELEAAAIKTQLETAARSDLLARRAADDEQLARDEAALDQRAQRVARGEANLVSRSAELDQREEQVDAAYREVDSLRDRATGIERDARSRRDARRGQLEERAGIGARDIIDQLGRAWIDDARARAAAALRAVEQTAADPAHDREARRLMEIASSRYHHHYLTERAMNHLRIGSDLVAALLDRDGAMLKALERVSTLQLLVNDDKTAVRLDGLDGVGKEMVRRALGRLLKKPETLDGARQDPEGWATKARSHLEQEIRALGKKAFHTLGIPKANPEIVELVGALNFRTSYTQNQWWHAVEASYLAGMIADEMGLDAKLARRATLMHDIGKALTHKIEGSHAVIGADIARRVGESELVANAIGAHHADEPCNSAYAHLVAASDAMSGARPGARRELAEGFTAKIEDLERIGMARRGVSHAHAVQGGRELRVYVRERDVDDLTVVELSSEIAAQISDEMTFPGQIKVTVIRAFEATSTAN